MKKLHLLSLLALSAACLSACGGGNKGDNSSNGGDSSQNSGESSAAKEISAKDVTVGLICLHGAYSTYDNNFIIAMQSAKEKLGFNLVVKQDIAEGVACYDTAKSLAEQGCNIIFADSFGHEQYMIQAAKEFKDVLFCHATGTNGAKENLSNFGDAFASIYEGRYLAGVAGGLKMKAEIDAGKYTAAEAKVGYVGAYTYAEIISGFTSFYLGVRSVVPEATMSVKYTGSWYDEDGEKAVANELIDSGCKLISQHADSHGAPTACEAKKVPNVSYNGSTLSDGPSTYLISSRINWGPYYEHVINNYVAAKNAGQAPSVENDFTGTLANDSVQVSPCSVNCPDGAQAQIDAVKAELVAGTRHVFDTSKFTINGAAPSEENMRPANATWADLASDAKFLNDGYYHESEMRSAPSFDKIIDGITELNQLF